MKEAAHMDRTKPIRKPFVVASNKVTKFEAQKPNETAMKRMQELSALCKKNNVALSQQMVDF